MYGTIESVLEKIKKVSYICNNIVFEYEEDGYLYFDAVDTANCGLAIRVKIDGDFDINDWKMYESYDGEWKVIQ